MMIIIIMHLLFYCVVINYDDFTMHLFTLQQLLDGFKKKVIDTVLIPTVGNFIKHHKAFKYYAKIRFSYDAADLCSCFVLSYRFLKCTETNKKYGKEEIHCF